MAVGEWIRLHRPLEDKYLEKAMIYCLVAQFPSPKVRTALWIGMECIFWPLLSK